MSNSGESSGSDSHATSNVANWTSIDTSITTAAPIDVVASTSTAVSSVENHDGNFTKTGELRKRKRYDKTKLERKEEQARKQRQKHYIRPGCVVCHRRCKALFNKDHRTSINTQYWSMNWQERRRNTTFDLGALCAIEDVNKESIVQQGPSHFNKHAVLVDELAGKKNFCFIKCRGARCEEKAR
ncbi:hypothetical protein QE152_g29061 [Popillia japonica]|uniref:Uncharacterized protein n=1 Tax=Popillia japonica TaxID=7064 RepID=A0AAW1JIU9_POPJA